MSRKRIPERVIYIAVIVLSIAALGLIFLAPPDLLEANVVYQGF